MKLFKKPSWLKPEIDDPKYWLHLYIIAIVALWLLQYFTGTKMLTISNVWWSTWLLLAGDVVAHTLLKLN